MSPSPDGSQGEWRVNAAMRDSVPVNRTNLMRRMSAEPRSHSILPIRGPFRVFWNAFYCKGLLSPADFFRKIPGWKDHNTYFSAFPYLQIAGASPPTAQRASQRRRRGHIAWRCAMRGERLPRIRPPRSKARIRRARYLSFAGAGPGEECARGREEDRCDSAGYRVPVDRLMLPSLYMIVCEPSRLEPYN